MTFGAISAVYAQNEGERLADWKKGELEIHHISTGKGDAVFCIFPDGTNLLIDAGDKGPFTDPRNIEAKPNESKQAGEWIARYIARRIPEKEKRLDYVLLTHFHVDHIGGVFKSSPVSKKGGDYKLSGITELAEHLKIGKIIDRDWPDYSYPAPPLRQSIFKNYKNFIDWNITNSGLKVEALIPGGKDQISLKYDSLNYRSAFTVRNIMANGFVWTGKGNAATNVVPSTVPPASVPENLLSAGVKISYGAFDYFAGGDIYGRIPFDAPSWMNIERPIADVLGRVEAMTANHHGWIDAMSDYFVSVTQPKVVVLQVNHVTHLNFETLNSLNSTSLYPQERYVFPTAIPAIASNYLGKELIANLKGGGGHIVIRVVEGGSQFMVYVIDNGGEDDTIKQVFGPFRSE